MHWPGPRQEGELGSLTRIPACQCAQCEYEASKTSIYHSLAFDDYDDIDLHATTTLSDDQYMLCFSHVYAYALQDRLWDLLDVEGLKAPRIDRDVINTLVMRPESNKAMVKAICETYGQKQERENLFFADFIRGKGEGQVMLLHGPPGTGKTLTAESIAEYTQRPLLSITAADLGHEPDLLEKNLLRFFRNATKWDAIVLLDEADVFLERRSANDLRRNSIVSVFLRALDYFQGILFLTTNRVGSFDEAFMSRIHLQIGYAPLDDSARLQVWNNSFKKLSANHKQGGKEIQYSFSAKEYVKSSKTLHSLRWNGREIRNGKYSGTKTPYVTKDDH
ncbi:26S protease regulatory subunit 8 [Diplodia seriata]|uniref:26S protease regulatory subunit 8 n=1 Tax=Diplodia seriata TaxID=420778 RepID=A0A1S8BCT1_9PEZI|nr:26S protease regulatory subunit 8 [Diplodia seriata]